MRLLTVRGVVKRHQVKWFNNPSPIEEQIKEADIFEEEVQFVFKENTIGYTHIIGRYINYDWYYIDNKTPLVVCR
jgi:hypothetical protein